MADANVTPLKVCTKCGRAKAATTDNFKAEKRVRCGLTAQCRDCLYRVTRQSLPAWYAKTRAERNAWQRAYRKTPGFLDREREWVRKYRAANYDKIKARIDGWVAANPERVRALKAVRERTRRARAFNAPGTHTVDDVDALRRDQRDCLYCDVPLGGDSHVDHFVPLAKGGSNDPSNLVLACPTCNMRKHARLPWEWMPERFARPKES